MFSFKNIFKRTVVTVNLDANVTQKVEPVCGGVNAILSERGDIFDRTERAYFSSLEDLIRSLRLTDDVIIRKLSKAF